MDFDIRLPIGLLFLAIGVLLAFQGLSGGPQLGSHGSLDIDFAWGIVMALFGAAMLALAAASRRS